MARTLPLCVAVAIVVGVVAGAGEAATPVPDGLVLYQHEAEHGSWIEVRDLGDGSRRALTPRLQPSEMRRDSDASWSEDGAVVAFVRQTGKSEAIYVVDADGSNLRRVVTLASLRPLAGQRISTLSRAAWSPDGSTLLFTVRGPRTAGCIDEGLFAVGADRSGLRRLWRRPRSLTETLDHYDWSPDVSRVLFTIDRNDAGGCRDDDYFSSDLDVVSDPRRNLQRVATDSSIGGPTWSPDGDAIAYSVDCDTVCNLAVAFPNGGRSRRITHFRPQSVGYGFTHYAPFAWSGRGNEIVFGHPLGSGDGRSLYSIDADTGASRRLVTVPCPGPKRSCTYSLIDLYRISSDGTIVVFDVERDARGSATTIQRYAAFIDEKRLVRLPRPPLIVDDVYLS